MMWLGLAVALLVYLGAISPWASPLVPRFVLPAVAAAGAALISWSLVRSLARIVRSRRAGEPCRLVPLAVNVVAAVILVALPGSRLVGLLMAGSGSAPRTLVGFGDWLGGEGYPRLSAHRGVDIAGHVGSDVLAAADGRVTVARDNRDACGLIVVVAHEPHVYRTVYCHLSVLAVTAGEHVTRGQRLGALGTTGQRAWPGFEHVHLELQRGASLNDLEDPGPRLVGCFDSSRTYPTDHLLLIYPVRC
jgi:murein DD-endopeptidase MepM/ murein hydrolase activator NlpD